VVSTEEPAVNARNALLSGSALLAATLTSCGTLNRIGKDVAITVASPLLVPYCAASDGWATSKNIRAGLDSGVAVEVLSFPITYFYHGVKHFVMGPVLHSFDLFLWPYCGLAELHGLLSGSPDRVIKPLDFYQGSVFDTWAENGFGFEPWSKARRGGTDAESGVMVPQGN
jgi:hypothetical protein